jgi:type II secretory pathway component GspD/PulD (secretin)
MRNYLHTSLFICLSLSFFATFSARAQTASLDLRSVSVSDLSRIVFKEMLKADYVLAPDVVSSDAKLSLTLGNQSKISVIETFKITLEMAGFSVQKKGDVYYVSKAVPSSQIQPQSLLLDNFPTPVSALNGVEKDSSNDFLKEQKFYTYKAKARPISYLTKIAKFSGAKIIDGELSGDVLLYAASDDVKQRLDSLLAVVDVPAQSVTIKAALIEFSDSNDSGNSFALSILTDRLKATFAAGASLANSVTFVGATVKAALSVVAGDSRFNYLSQPMLRVLDGQTARLSVGSDVPTRGAVTLDKNGVGVQSIQYQSSGVILSVTPHFVGDLINLSLDQQISSFAATTTSNIDSPSLFKRQASTTVDIKKGQLIVLAGLDEDKDTLTNSGLSFLPSSFWSHSKNKTKSQILLLLEVPDDKESVALY